MSPASWCARRWSCRVVKPASARRNRACATLGTIDSVQELAALPITLGDGRNIRLDSIANVRDQAAEVRQEVRLDGKPVIGFQVMRAWGEGALKVADGTRAAVKETAGKVSRHPASPRSTAVAGQGNPRELPWLDDHARRGRHPRDHRGVVLPARHPRHADLRGRAAAVGHSRPSGHCTCSASR